MMMMTYSVFVDFVVVVVVVDVAVDEFVINVYDYLHVFVDNDLIHLNHFEVKQFHVLLIAGIDIDIVVDKPISDNPLNNELCLRQ